MRHLIFLILVLTLIAFCVQDTTGNVSESKQGRNNSDTLVHFRKFLHKFKILSLPFTANTSCYQPNPKLSVTLNPANDSLFVKNAEDGILVGMFPDTSSFYALIYCRAVSCYIPVLAVFSKGGKQISEEYIATGCGGGCGYKCSDSLAINSMSDITQTYILETYTCDSNGNETPGTWSKTIDINKFSINKLGKIKKINTHQIGKKS